MEQKAFVVDEVDMNPTQTETVLGAKRYLAWLRSRYYELSAALNDPMVLYEGTPLWVPMACPDSGAFVGWKKCCDGNSKRNRIVKLLVPEDAKRSSATGRECRADKAVVLEIQNMEGRVLKNAKAFSQHDPWFVYRVGETVTPREPFDEDRWNKCGSGIHFFINRKEAVDY